MGQHSVAHFAPLVAKVAACILNGDQLSAIFYIQSRSSADKLGVQVLNRWSLLWSNVRVQCMG